MENNFFGYDSEYISIIGTDVDYYELFFILMNLKGVSRIFEARSSETQSTPHFVLECLPDSKPHVISTLYIRSLKNFGVNKKGNLRVKISESSLNSENLVLQEIRNESVDILT